MNIGHQNRVLDVCTGNGIWCADLSYVHLYEPKPIIASQRVLEMAREFPLVDFVGFDHGFSSALR